MSASNPPVITAAARKHDFRILPRWTPLRYAGLFAGVLLLGSAAIVSMNFWLDPLNFDARFQNQVAREFEQGGNHAVYDLNVDFRGLRREHIRQMKITPDVVIFAGSRFELASRNLFPNRSFYNAFGHSDYFEDLLAITELLRANDRLPKNLVLSVRFATFLPLAERKTDEWKMFWPEYRAMADRLGVDKVSFADNFPWRHWTQLLSIEALKHRLQLAASKKPAPGPTSADRLPDMALLNFKWVERHAG
jgi:hypothetical protein